MVPGLRRMWRVAALCALVACPPNSQLLLAQELTPLPHITEIPGKPRKPRLTEVPGKPKLRPGDDVPPEPSWSGPNLFYFSKQTWPTAGAMSAATWDEISSWKMIGYPTPGKNLVVYTCRAWWEEDLWCGGPTLGAWLRAMGGEEGARGVYRGALLGILTVPLALFLGVIATTTDILAMPHRLCGVGEHGLKWVGSRNYPLAAAIWLPTQVAPIGYGLGGTVLDVAAAPHRLAGLGPNGTTFSPRPRSQSRLAQIESYNAELEIELARLNANIDRHNAEIDRQIQAYNAAVDACNAALAAGLTATRPTMPK